MPWVDASVWLREYERRRGEGDDRQLLTTKEVEEALAQDAMARRSHTISQAKRRKAS